ncbi:MAG: DMT family transporter [Colwellia sp.]|nr:DMT family transporter [Colwellia sp.]
MSQNNFVANTTTGLSLALLTALLWSILPLALAAILLSLDGVTITWFRFTFAAVICFFWQLYRGKLNEFMQLTPKDWFVLTLAAVFLIIDYVGFTLALNYISPIAATVFSQVTPFFLCIGGIIFFKERLNYVQIWCFVLLFIGLMLFFNDSLTAVLSEQEMLVIGAVIAVLSSLIWVFYALLQKSLLKRLSATNILLYIYALAIVLLAPVSDLQGFVKLDGYDWLILLFCALNTVVAYGAFAQSMKHIDTTQVSVIIATIPLFTIVLSYLAFVYWPQYFTFEQINQLGWLGVFMVVASVVIFNQAGNKKVIKI